MIPRMNAKTNSPKPMLARWVTPRAMLAGLSATGLALVLGGILFFGIATSDSASAQSAVAASPRAAVDPSVGPQADAGEDSAQATIPGDSGAAGFGDDAAPADASPTTIAYSPDDRSVMTVANSNQTASSNPYDSAEKLDFGGPAPEDRDRDEGTPVGSARIRYLDGDLRLTRAEDETVESATMNAPVYSGDTVSSATGGRAEIQLDRGGVIRLDQRSTLVLLSLPLHGATDEDTVLQLTEGSVDVEVRKQPDRDVDFRIDTPSASVYVLAAGRYRIDINGKYGQSRVSCYRGVAEVAGDDGSVMLRSGQRTFAQAEREPESPRAFNTAFTDAFDSWVQDRTGVYYRADADTGSDSGGNSGSGGYARSDEQVDEEDIPDAVQPYQAELSYYGHWVTIAPYGPCWIPYGVNAGWRPYWNGYWQYGPSGAFWVSSDPWGWAPYHYGRWVWSSGFGWCWNPGYVFAPAWVSWYYGPTYVGWAPLGFWDYPCSYTAGFIGIDYRCWNFTTYHNVYVRNVHKTYVTSWNVRNEVAHGGSVVVNHPVRFSPRDVREDRVTPAFVVTKARDIVRSTPQSAVTNGGGAAAGGRGRIATRQTFRDRERQVVRTQAMPRGAGNRRNVAGAPSNGAGGGYGTTVRPRPRTGVAEGGGGQAGGGSVRPAAPRPRAGGVHGGSSSSAPRVHPRSGRPRSSLSPDVESGTPQDGSSRDSYAEARPSYGSAGRAAFVDRSGSSDETVADDRNGARDPVDRGFDRAEGGSGQVLQRRARRTTEADVDRGAAAPGGGASEAPRRRPRAQDSNVTNDAAAPSGVPRRHPRAEGATIPDGGAPPAPLVDQEDSSSRREARGRSSQPDRNLREFFRDSSPRPSGQGRPEPPRVQAPPPQPKPAPSQGQAARAPEHRPDPPPKPAHDDKPHKP